MIVFEVVSVSSLIVGLLNLCVLVYLHSKVDFLERQLERVLDQGWRR